MSEFKEMIIKRPRVGVLPTLDLQGRWLETLGFTVGASVSVVYRDSCLTLSTNTTAPNCSGVLQVTSRLMRGRPRTLLTLNAFLLKRYGFNVGDKVVLQLMPNTIQITKINFYTTAQHA